MKISKILMSLFSSHEIILSSFSVPEKLQYIIFCFRSSFSHSTLSVFVCAHYIYQKITVFFAKTSVIAPFLLFFGVHLAHAIDWQAQAGSEIKVMLSEHPWTSALRDNLAEFEEMTGIKVTIDSFAEDLYTDRMNLAVRSKNNLVDVYMVQMDHAIFAQYEAGVIAPLDMYLNDSSKTEADYDLADYPPSFLQGAQFPVAAEDGELYAIPISFETFILFYNKDLVAQYLDGHVPTTMDGLINAAQKVTQAGNGRLYGTAMRGKRSAELVDTMTSIVLNSWGGQEATLPYNFWFDGSFDNPRFDDERITQGLTHYAELLKAGAPASLAYGWEDASLFFSQGRSAFFIDASVFGPGFEDAATSSIAGSVGYAPMPAAQGERSYSGHWAWGISIAQNSQQKDAAWAFVQWATGKKMTARLGVATGGAPRDSAWDDPAYVGALNPDYVAAVKAQMQYTRPTSVFHHSWNDVVLRLVDAIHQIYQGMAPQEAAASVQRDVAAIIH